MDSVTTNRSQYIRIFLHWLVFLSLASVLALGAFGLLDPVRAFLDQETLTVFFGETRISVYVVLKSLLVLVFIFWIAMIISGIMANRISRLVRLRPSNRELLLKTFQIAIYLFAFLVSLDILGIDLTTLAIFSGALGIGLGFGFQKIASNFISGIILLLEKTVEQDDLVEMADGTFGFITKAGARFTLIKTFQGKEIMVPNEDFITNPVVNWTYSDKSARIEIPIGVSYGSDIALARQLMLEAVNENPSCAKDPAPSCHLREFGDSSVNFMLHFWIEDVTTGRWGPQSEVMFSIWNKFKENNIVIPFPQRDVHLFKEGKINEDGE